MNHLHLAEAPLKCRKCRDVKWFRLSHTFTCEGCARMVVAQTEQVSEEHGGVTSTYKCFCGNAWTTWQRLERPCCRTNCDGTMRLMLESEMTATPVASECCSTICWEQLGGLGGFVLCRRCRKHTSATRRIGVNHATVLAYLYGRKSSTPFTVTAAQVGPVVFCTTLSARDHPRARALRTECRATVHTNHYDALPVVSSDE